jgi:hypothetical protein
MADLQELSSELSDLGKGTKEILHFVDEIILQRDAEVQRNLLYFLADKSSTKKTRGFTMRDRSLVIRRLHIIREVPLESGLGLGLGLGLG